MPAPYLKPFLKPLAVVMLAGVAGLSLTACAVSPMTTGSIGGAEAKAGPAGALPPLQARFKNNPKDRTNTLQYAATLRANGQPDQAVAVLESAIGHFKGDPGVLGEYAKALAAAGRFEQALSVIEGAIDPTAPDWNALMVKGAILDQSGRNQEARMTYQTALKIAPQQPSLHANLGLSYAMTNDLVKAEQELRIAAGMRGANSQIRQNLALIVGLQGRFEEARTLFTGELPQQQVEANMAYIRALLTQQNRWDLVKGTG